MYRPARAGWLAALLAIAAPMPRILAAQQGAVSGTVTMASSGVGIADARIVAEPGGATARTDSSGHFVLRGLAAGRQMLRVTAIGFAPGVRDVVVTPGTSTDGSFALEPRAARIAEVTVIGTRSDLAETRERVADVPGGVALVEPAEIRATRQANLKDVLGSVPGVWIQPRFGAADESQISVRGSGLRNNYHARGVNLLVNGMPYRNADGFTDFESLELLTADAIEVYKGANALRYGGGTLGGAINLQTKTGYSARWGEGFGEGGSFGFRKGQLASGGKFGSFDYYTSYAHTSLDGYRAWSDQGRDRVNAHVGYRLSPALDLRAFYLFARVREHLPGALTPAELADDPRAADPANVANRWGRAYDLHHAGVQLRAQLSPSQRVEVAPYFQYRDIDHPIFQVINQQSRDVGAEVRYENTGSLFGRGNRLTVGYQPAYLNMDNRQFENVQGEHGALRKDQKDEVVAHGAYIENAWRVTGRLTAVTGLRYDYSVRRSRDFFLSDGDQSDRRSFSALSPKVGALYDVADGVRLFANASRSFEPPLLLELNSLTVPGFIQLRGQDAWQFEVGTRGASGPLAWELSLYDVELSDEILNLNVQPFPGAPFTVPTYRNAERTRHYGLEAGLTVAVPGAFLTRRGGGDALKARLAYTLARYTFVRDTLFTGNEIPGAPRHHLTAQLDYSHPAGFSITPSVEWVPSAYFATSANTARAEGWATLGVRAEWTLAKAGVTIFAAAQNLTNTRYAATIQVDNAAGRYLEPADGRAFYVGTRLAP
jgi:iron complex outermembrane receptor protein